MTRGAGGGLSSPILELTVCVYSLPSETSPLNRDRRDY